MFRPESRRGCQQDNIEIFNGHHFFVTLEAGKAILFGHLQVEGFEPFAEGINLVLEDIAGSYYLQVRTGADEVDGRTGSPVPASNQSGTEFPSFRSSFQ